MNGRVKRIAYHHTRDCKIIFSDFRETFLNKYYPGDKKAVLSFRKDLYRLAANFSYPFFFQYSLFSQLWFHKHIYKSIILSGETGDHGEEIRRASLDGTILYLPNHSAHIDSLIISWIADHYRVPQPLFFAWNTLAKRRSSYLMPMVNACLLNREIMDKRYPCTDPFKNTREYHLGYTILIDKYLNRMLTLGVDTLIYPEGGRSYSGTVRDARIKRIFKNVVKIQQNSGFLKKISLVPVSLTYSLVPEAESLIHSFQKGTICPPSSLFHDIQYGDDLYRSCKPVYQTKTDFPFINAFTEKGIPVFSVVGKPISLKDNPGISLQECFDMVKRNRKILPHYFMARLLITDPSGMADRWKASGINGLMEPARILRNSLPKARTDEAFFCDDGLSDIISIGMDFMIYQGWISQDGRIRNYPVLEYYSNASGL
jgi:1-acyl-sn-glycerol-3-phosphate acyltransferase